LARIEAEVNLDSLRWLPDLRLDDAGNPGAADLRAAGLKRLPASW
jgi:hypothetical protein